MAHSATAWFGEEAPKRQTEGKLLAFASGGDFDGTMRKKENFSSL